MRCEVSCQKDKLEKMGTPHHMLDKKKYSEQLNPVLVRLTHMQSTLNTTIPV